MAKRSISLPDDLEREVRHYSKEMNISAVCARALRDEIAMRGDGDRTLGGILYGQRCFVDGYRGGKESVEYFSLHPAHFLELFKEAERTGRTDQLDWQILAFSKLTESIKGVDWPEELPDEYRKGFCRGVSEAIEDCGTKKDRKVEV